MKPTPSPPVSKWEAREPTPDILSESDPDVDDSELEQTSAALWVKSQHKALSMEEMVEFALATSTVEPKSMSVVIIDLVEVLRLVA